MSETKEINILVLSAGRRVELVRCFDAARNRLGIRGGIYAMDASKLAPALYFADDKIIAPLISENDDYIKCIIDTCNKYEIDLIVPTIDTELILLSGRKEEIENATRAKVLISSKEVIKICRDKKNTQKFLEENGFSVPRMITDADIDRGNVTWPVFIKPLDGSSSVNAFKADDREELDTFKRIIGEGKYIIQDFMEGTEYTVDAFVDFDGNPVTVVPRIRLAVRSGEILKGRIAKNDEIVEDILRLLKVLKPIGHITLQCMKTENGIKYIEINPRFGGGAPMSIKAGADSCENLYRLLQGEKLSYNEDYRKDLTFLRFDACIMLNEELELEGSDI
ncbi:MAG: ATP-grasp domain-containing protein [Lachnospiraceae bacterium]|nr:ATP-grasp domain-containing protein [Lachnospiraceae bacterium]